MSRSCQSGMPSVTGVTYAADDPGQPGDPLGHDRVLLVRHRTGTLLPGPERLGQLPDLGALPVPHLQPDRLAHRDQDRQRRHPLGDAVAQHDLGGDVGRPQPQRRGDRRPPAPGPRTSTSPPRRRSWPPRRPPGPAAAGPGTGPRPKAKSASRCPNTSGSAWIAVRAADPQGVPVLQAALPQRRDQRRRPWPAARRWPRPAAAPAPCPAGRRRSVRSGRTRRPRAGVVLSAQADRNAITSCWVTSSIAATASGVGGGGVQHRLHGRGRAPCRRRRARPAPCRSTRHHSSYLWASLQTAPISGNV